MIDRPIIFSASMVRALLDGRKTMTRRTKYSPRGPLLHWHKVQAGDRLWVRESLQAFHREPKATAQYVASLTAVPHRGMVDGWCDGRAYWQWSKDKLPSIHMPRWASRLTLIVTATKIERLQQIDEADALAEGIDDLWLVQNHVPPPRAASFKYLWDDLHGAGSWKANPEVVALTFTAHEQNIDTLPKAEAA